MEAAYRGGQTGSSSKNLDKTEEFYKAVIDKVMEKTKKIFSENGVSDKVRDKLKKVSILSLKDIFVCIK